MSHTSTGCTVGPGSGDYRSDRAGTGTQREVGGKKTNERLNLRARHFTDGERKTMRGDEEDTEEEKEEDAGVLHK